MVETNGKNYGILVDYEYCTGCHSCEVACKKELDLPAGQFGVQLSEVGPWKIDDDHWEWVHMPVFTKKCNMCKDRVAEGKIPSCVHHCQAYCMYYGTVEELTKKMNGKSRTVLCVPQKQE